MYLKIIKILILVFGLGQMAQAQKQFVKIPTPSAQLYSFTQNVVEINHEYFFLTYHNAVQPENLKISIHKTDSLGNILDSIMFRQSGYPDSFLVIDMAKDNYDRLVLFTLSGKYDSSTYSTNSSLSRIRYTANLNFVDSFTTPISSNALVYSLFFAKQIGNKIYFNLAVSDTTSISIISQTRIFILDTAGHFISEKNFNNKSSFVSDFSASDDTSKIYAYIASENRLCKLTTLMDTIATVVTNNILVASPSVSDLKNNRLYLATRRPDLSGLGSNIDSLCIGIYDSNLTEIKRYCISRDSLTYPYYIRFFQREIFDPKDINNIYIGTTYNGSINSLMRISYFTLHNLDSNLNLRWSRIFGGDMPYQIYRHYSTTDGGCFLTGIRRLGLLSTDTLEPVVFKISQQGVITNIFSFAPSAQTFFTTYPNPSKGICTIKNTSNTAYELLVFSQAGKVVFQQDAINHELFSFDFSAYANGAYFYKIMTKDGRSAGGKIIKE